MRWFWQRRRQRQTVVEPPPPAPTTTTHVQRAQTTSGRLGQPRQITNELLLLARDYLQAAGGRVRVEDEDMISATLPDGRLVRYTITQAKARADESATLLVEGSSALVDILEDVATRARITALQLPPIADATALVLDWCAAPGVKCSKCLKSANTSDIGFAELCEACPLRDGRAVLRWQTRGPLSARVIQQEQDVAIELAYLVAARDRQGRRDEWIRLAVDVESGNSVPSLTESLLASALAGSLPLNYEKRLRNARAFAERALEKPLAATGIFLRQRSLDEYRRRLEEVATTFDRLQRETPETARAAKAGRNRELSALSEIYAVDVEAQLESCCFVTSPYAVVAIRPPKAHGELHVRVDLGRKYVIPPNCANCGVSVRAGYICNSGHAVCTHCAAVCSQCDAWSCPACEELSQTACAKCGQPIAHSATPDAITAMHSADGVFAVRHLEVLPPEMWLTAIEWLLACQGITVESRRNVGELTLLQGQSQTGKIMIAALHTREKLALDEFAFRQTATHLPMEQAMITRMILSMSPATASARQTAQQLGIQLVERDALDNLLSTLALAHDLTRERQLEEIQARADTANLTRQAMLDTIDAIERVLAPLKRSRRGSSGGATGAAASRALVEARMVIERASLAWETLLADWVASFSERPARNNSLVIQAENGRFEEMVERTAHLRAILLDAITLLAATPARGEAGYNTWRQAVVEECVARCEAWNWRIRTYNPAQWSDFTRAWDTKAASKAAEATTAAGHATARADKAQAQAQRAG